MLPVHGNSFFVAMDRNLGKGCKGYASYPNASEFVRTTLVKTSHRHLYEVIPGPNPLKFATTIKEAVKFFLFDRILTLEIL